METSQQFRLNLSDGDSNSSELQALTRELTNTLDRQRDISASLPEGLPEPGKKGDPQTIGSILLQLAGSGGVIVSLIGVLKTYFERKPTLELELQRPDGAKLKVHADSFKSNEIEPIRAEFEKFLKG